jgi:hypothetical protein
MTAGGPKNSPDPVLGATRAGAPHLAESLARIGVMLDAQRTELFRHVSAGMDLTGWWAAQGFEIDAFEDTPPMPTSWFPWSLGNIRPMSHVFVCNAGPLSLRPASSARVRDIGMGSALHLPLHNGTEVIGAVCVYWADEQDDWRIERCQSVVDIARDALLDIV